MTVPTAMDRMDSLVAAAAGAVPGVAEPMEALVGEPTRASLRGVGDGARTRE